MLNVVNGKLVNSRDIAAIIVQHMAEGMSIRDVCEMEGMPSPTQLAIMRRTDPQFAEALAMGLEACGIQAAFTLVGGALSGKIGKNQLDAAKWVAERMAPELFQERKTVTQNLMHELSDEELQFQLQAAMRSDERVRKIVTTLEGEVTPEGGTVELEEAKEINLKDVKNVLREAGDDRILR